jgi:hypothetical protein
MRSHPRALDANFAHTAAELIAPSRAIADLAKVVPLLA